MVLALSIKVKPVTKNGQIHNLAFQDTWASSQPLPDLMLLIVEPSPLQSSTLVKLNDHGWGLCHAELPDYMKVCSSQIMLLLS